MLTTSTRPTPHATSQRSQSLQKARALLERLEAVSASQTRPDEQESPDEWARIALNAGLSEWFSASGADGGRRRRERLPPLAVLIGLAHDAAGAAPGRRAVWIGRWCWPYPPALALRCPASDCDLRLLERSVFVDPTSRAERVWAIEVASRCGGVACVIADGSGLTMAESRRLHLAATGNTQRPGVPVLLARPPEERRALSAARTRWRVSPAAPAAHDDTHRQGWLVELLRCKGLRPNTPGNVRCWGARRDHATGHITLEAHDRSAHDGDLAAEVVNGPDSPTGPIERSRIA